MRGSFRSSNSMFRALSERDRMKKMKRTELFYNGRWYEYRSDSQIFRHDPTKLVRIKKAEWLAIQAAVEGN